MFFRHKKPKAIQPPEMQNFLPEKKQAIRELLEAKANIGIRMSVLRELEGYGIVNADAVLELQAELKTLTADINKLRYPELVLPQQPLLLGLTNDIAKNVDRAVKAGSQLTFAAHVDVLTEKMILTIKRYDQRALNHAAFSKFEESIKRYFIELMGESNVSLSAHQKSKRVSELGVSMNYLQLLHKSKIVQGSTPSRSRLC